MTKHFNNSTIKQPPDARIPPQAKEVERAVLGSMMIESDAAGIAVQMLKEEDFYAGDHRKIFNILVDLYDEDSPMDLLTVEEKLRDAKYLDKIGGPGYLSELTRSVSSAANIDYHAQLLKEKTIKRKVIAGASGIIKEAYDSESDAYDILDELGKLTDELTLGDENRPGRTLAESLPDALDNIEAARQNPSNITGVASGLDIDHWTAGWQPGDLITIGARPSMGKTGSLITMARNMITHPNPEHRTGVVAFSLEMARQKYIERILAQESRLENENFRSGKISDQEFERLCTSIAPKLYERSATMVIDDTPALSLRQLRSKARSYLRKHPDIGIIMIDYLQLMNNHANPGDTDTGRIGFTTKNLKALAKELKVPIILYSQLSRAVETRGGDKRPQLSDLRESGDIEQDSDIVIFLYRPKYYEITTDAHGNKYPGNYAEFILSKQRNGPVGKVELYFKEEYALFGNRADSWAEHTLETEPQKEKKSPNKNGKQINIDDEPGF